MGNNSPKQIENEFDKIQSIVTKIKIYLSNYKNEILDICKTKKNLEKDIINFQLNYSTFEGLERFSIPVIGQISSGKSTFLNMLLDLKDSLQVQSKTTTKFVSIIRHNKSLKDQKPRIYTVKFTERTEQKNHYNFEKEEYIEEDIKFVIEKRNEDIANKKLPNIPQNYFYIIESYIPFFSGENEIYADYFEFLDIPGLNENSDNLDKENIYYEKVLPLIINNIKFSLFIFDISNYQNSKNSTELYKKYIKMLNSRNKDYFNEKQILNDIQKNSIYILNKTDLYKEADDLKKEKEKFEKYLESYINVNLESNKIFLISSKNSIIERQKFENFNNYLEYIISSPKKKEHFLPNLSEKMQEDFSIQINIPENIEFDEEDEENGHFLDDLIQKMENNDFIGSFTRKQYDYFKNIFDSNIKNKKEGKNDINQLIKIIINSIDSVYKNFIDIKNIENLVKTLDEYFLKEDQLQNEKTNKQKIKIERILNNENYEKSIQTLGAIFSDLKLLEPEHEFIENMYDNFKNSLKYIYDDYKYRILFLGGRASGKTSIINSFIGYNLDLIPLSQEWFTKIILIIRYTYSLNDIALYQTSFNEHNENSSFYYFKKENLIVKGKEKIKNKLIELNKEAENMNEIRSFILETPIEFLNDYIENDYKKEQIEFIDLPGINTQNEILEKEFLSNLIKYSELFLFVNDKNIIQEENKEIIDKFFSSIIRDKSTFNLNSILFIVNKIDLISEIKNKETQNKIIQEFSDEINNLFQEVIAKNWNNYLNLRKIAKTEEKISCTFFSSQKYKTFKRRIDCEEMIISILKDYKGKNFKIILKQVKQNYSTFVENKNEIMNSNQIPIDDTILKKFLAIFIKYKYSKEDLKCHYDEIKEVVKIYDYIIMNPNKIKYNYNFTDLFHKIKDKILEKNYYLINSMILNLIIQLNVDFQRINLNLFKYKINQKIEPQESIKVKNIYEDFKNKINKKYEKDKEKLKNLIQQIIDEKNNNDNYYKDFEKILNELNSFLVETLKLYSEKINKAHQENIEKYTPENIKKDEYLINIEFLGDSNYLEKWGNGIKYMGVCAGILCLFAEQSLTSLCAGFIFGGMVGIGGGIAITPVILLYEGIKYFYKSHSANKKREEKINIQLKHYLDNLEIMKNQILNNMYSLYKIISRDIKMLKISQQNPMKNIYKNIEQFKKLEEKFRNFVADF